MSLNLVRRSKVWVLSVDEDRRRIGLSAVGPGDGQVAASVNSQPKRGNDGKRGSPRKGGHSNRGGRKKSRPSRTIPSPRFLNNLHIFWLRCAYVATLPT